MRKIKTALNIPDCHIPWQDRSAYDVMIEVARAYDDKCGLDQINILGDYLDFYHVGLHPKLPEHFTIKGTFKDEIQIANHELARLRRLFPKSEIRFIEGNHEFRLLRYLVKKCPELFDIVSVPELLQLDKHDIMFIPYGKKQLVQCLDTDYHLRHVPYSGSKHTAMATLDKKKTSLGFGHTHRKQSVTVTDAHGRELYGRSLGWLGDRLAPVFSFMDHDDWSQGFEFVASENTIPHHQYIDLKSVDSNRSAIFDGNIYTLPYKEPYNGTYSSSECPDVHKL